MTPEQLAEHLARFPTPGVKIAPVKLATLPHEDAPAKPKRKPRVARTRNGGTWTEAFFWGYIRHNCLRRAFRFWKPATQALKQARAGKDRYLCSGCSHVFTRKQVQIDHRFPCGKLTDFNDLPGFVARLTAEDPWQFQIFCKPCHQAKTNAERKSP